MVINYERLNDNTYDDQCKILDKDMLINFIQGCKIISKFDCKSGFWQVRMDSASIKWTAFSCPKGHLEWFIMPFGLKNGFDIKKKKENYASLYRRHIGFQSNPCRPL